MITPQFTGQYYRDTSTGNIWKSNSTTPGDWSLVVQDMQVAWTPTNLKLGEMIGFFLDSDKGSDLSGITDLIFAQSVFASGFRLNGAADLESIAFPNLVSITGYQGSFDSFVLSNNSALTSFTAPLLASVGADFFVSGNTSLVSISLPSLVQGENFTLGGCTALATVSFPLWVPLNGSTIDLTACALNAASVNHLLARCVANPAFVSGVIDMSGGTSDAPTGQGIIDKATLNARQVGLAVTN